MDEEVDPRIDRVILKIHPEIVVLGIVKKLIRCRRGQPKQALLEQIRRGGDPGFKAAVGIGIAHTPVLTPLEGHFVVPRTQILIFKAGFEENTNVDKPVVVALTSAPVISQTQLGSRMQDKSSGQNSPGFWGGVLCLCPRGTQHQNCQKADS